MAAADGLRLYLDSLDGDGRPSKDIDSRIVCELQEDWAAVDGDAVELVSAKHRDVTTGPFTTVNALADAGGVAHLFGRWNALHETVTCRLVTTFGLSSDAQKLEKAWVKLRELRMARQPLDVPDDHRTSVADLCQALRSYCKELPSSWAPAAKPMPSPTDAEIAQVVRFMTVLDVEAEKPLRSQLEFAAANMYARPICNRLGLPIDPESIWAAVHDIFYARMRKAGPIPTGKLPAVLAYRVVCSARGHSSGEGRPLPDFPASRQPSPCPERGTGSHFRSLSEVGDPGRGKLRTSSDNRCRPRSANGIPKGLCRDRLQLREANN